MKEQELDFAFIYSLRSCHGRKGPAFASSLQPSLGSRATGRAEQASSMPASRWVSFPLGNKKWSKPQLRQGDFWFIQCIVSLIPGNRSLEQTLPCSSSSACPIAPASGRACCCAGGAKMGQPTAMAVLLQLLLFPAVGRCQKGLFLCLHRCSLQPSLLFTLFQPGPGKHSSSC